MSIVASILLNLSVSYQIVKLPLTCLLIDLLSGSLINILSIISTDLLSISLVSFLVDFLVDTLFDTLLIFLIDGTSVLSCLCIISSV